ncbi:MAG: hypothetical protein GY856_55280 [bacterium]|nr:hypothetical protein [bacterium]
MDDDIQFTEDLGLVVSGEMGLEIANPIYREIVPRVLTSTLEKQLRVVRLPTSPPTGGCSSIDSWTISAPSGLPTPSSSLNVSRTRKQRPS